MVTGIDYDADAALFTVHHDMGDTLASSVIACMGATPRPAGFAGEDTYRGRGVSYCATCDGMFFRGKQVFVIGGGNSACEEALFLSDIASSVTIVLRRDQFRAPDGVVQKVLAKDNIIVRYQTSILELSGEAMPTTITFKDNASGETHTESFEPGSFGIFVFTGTQPHTELVEHLVDLAPDDGILTDESLRPHARSICRWRYPFQTFTPGCDRCFGRSHSGNRAHTRFSVDKYDNISYVRLLSLNKVVGRCTNVPSNPLLLCGNVVCKTRLPRIQYRKRTEASYEPR